MQTINIQILNKKAIKILQELELKDLIKIRKNEKKASKADRIRSYKGAMHKQSTIEIENQLNELRKDWE